jgi:hypothetical protein
VADRAAGQGVHHMMSKKIEDLSDAELNRNLIYAGLFLVADELIKKLIINPVAAFYRNTTFGKGLPFTTYGKDVLARHKNKFLATLLYLRDHFEAISDDDLKEISLVGERRHSIAHELSTEIFNLHPQKDEEILSRARDALFKISNFWVYIELGHDPEFDDVEWATAHGADVTLLDLLIQRTRNLRVSPEFL